MAAFKQVNMEGKCSRSFFLFFFFFFLMVSQVLLSLVNKLVKSRRVKIEIKT